MSNISLSICRPCQQRLLALRARRYFNTTLPRPAIPPESPDYVHVPQSLQPELILPRRVKGVLPVPREIFPESKPKKSEPWFAGMATPSRKKSLDLTSASDTQIYKHQMADRRKSHLRDGVTELRARKSKIESQIATKSQGKQEERARLIAQAEREDERLTNSTVPTGMLPTGKRPPDRKALRRWDRKKEVVQKRAAEKREDRRVALHTLYMNARKFITTEEDLNDEIEQVFPDSDDPAFRTGATQGKDIWVTGKPPQVADLLKKTDAGNLSAGQPGRADVGNTNPLVNRLTGERIKKIAEELSGGKI